MATEEGSITVGETVDITVGGAEKIQTIGGDRMVGPLGEICLAISVHHS